MTGSGKDSVKDGVKDRARAAVLAGGDILATPALLRKLQAAGLVVAADSGLRHAALLGLTPDVVVGDFDSVSAADLARHADVPRLRHPPEKNLLDLELALDYACEQGAREIVVVGGLGGRFDQSLAAVLVAARLRSEGLDIHLDSGHLQLYPLAGPARLELALPPGQRFSVLSLAPESRLGIAGARYPLQDHPLAFGVGLGVSNEVAAPPLRLELSRGLIVLTVE